MSPKSLHSCFSKLYIFLQLFWIVLNNEECATAIVVTSKVVKLDMIAADLHSLGCVAFHTGAAWFERLDCLG